MKKILLFVSAGIIAISSFSSCKKAYNCECINSQGVKSTRTVLATTTNEAQKNCNEYGLTGHCEIK